MLRSAFDDDLPLSQSVPFTFDAVTSVPLVIVTVELSMLVIFELEITLVLFTKEPATLEAWFEER